MWSRYTAFVYSGIACVHCMQLPFLITAKKSGRMLNGENLVVVNKERKRVEECDSVAFEAV